MTRQIGAKLTLAVRLVSEAAAYRHESIPQAIRAIEKLGLGFSVSTEDAGAFTDPDTVYWL